MIESKAFAIQVADVGPITRAVKDHGEGLGRRPVADFLFPSQIMNVPNNNCSCWVFKNVPIGTRQTQQVLVSRDA